MAALTVTGRGVTLQRLRNQNVSLTYSTMESGTKEVAQQQTRRQASAPRRQNSGDASEGALSVPKTAGSSGPASRDS